MSEHHPISDLVSSAMQSIREMVDVNTIIGTPIETADGTTIIPISKVSFGFGAGGSEFAPKKSEEKDNLFGGGSGAGVSINPVGFLVVSGGDVKLVPVENGTGEGVDKLLGALPGVAQKISDFFKKKKVDKSDEIID